MIHTLHTNIDEIPPNHSIFATRKLHTIWKFIIIQDSVKAGKLQLQKDSRNTTQSIKTKKTSLYIYDSNFSCRKNYFTSVGGAVQPGCWTVKQRH